MLTKFELEKYNQENPHIYEVFEKFTLQVIDTGRKYFGAKAIMERVRFYSLIEAKNDVFKVNNNQVAFYARLFEARNAQFKGFFRKRRALADSMLFEAKSTQETPIERGLESHV